VILLHAVRLERVLAGLLLTASLAGSYSLRRERLAVDALVERREEQLTLLQRIETRDRSDAVAPTELVAGGARLRLIDDAAGSIEVRSPRELLVPSSGELSERSLTNPSERRFRPLASLESANELAISIASAVDRTFITGATGPNVSSCAITISGVTPVSTVAG